MKRRVFIRSVAGAFALGGVGLTTSCGPSYTTPAPAGSAATKAVTMATGTPATAPAAATTAASTVVATPVAAAAATTLAPTVAPATATATAAPTNATPAVTPTAAAATTAPTTAAPAVAPTTAAATAAAEKVAGTTVNLSGSGFDPKNLLVKQGASVEWINNDAYYLHTVTADDKSFDSGDLGDGGRFSFTFKEVGIFAYYCRYHGAPDGKGMSGTVTVQAA